MVQGDSEMWGGHPVLYYAWACQKAYFGCEKVHDTVLNW